jgi:type II restriction enzyme SfiI
VSAKKPSALSLNEIEGIEKLTLRWLFQAVIDFGMEAHEIFLRSPDDVKDVAEDVTRELLDRLPGFNVQQRIFGTVDYKRARYIITSEQITRQALFVDSKAEKTGRTATIQMSQTSMSVRQRRSRLEVDEKGFLPEISEYSGEEYLTTTA